MSSLEELDMFIYKIIKDKLYEMVSEYSFDENNEKGVYFFMYEFTSSLVNEIE